MATETKPAATEEAKIDLFEDDDEFEEFEIDKASDMPFNPFAENLLKEKLKGPNFLGWRMRLKIVLVIKKHYFVLSEERPQNAGIIQRKWDYADRMAKNYILASVSNVLKREHHKMVHAVDMICSLTKMFDEKWRAMRISTLRTLLNTRMSEWTPVGGHVIKMMGDISELENLDHSMTAESKFEIILRSLPPSFNQFALIYRMTNLEFTLPKLYKQLVMAEGFIRKDSGSADLNASCSTSSMRKRKRKRKRNQGQKSKSQGQPQPFPCKKAKVASSSKNKEHFDNPKGNCIHLQQNGSLGA